METLTCALKGKGSTWFGFDNPALGCPGVLAIAVVTVEGGPDFWPVESFMPLAGVTFLGPLTHTGDVRDCCVDLFGRSCNVASDLKSVGHTA